MQDSIFGKGHGIDGHVGDHLPFPDSGIRNVILLPVPVLIPVLKVQVKGLFGQTVKAASQRSVIPDIFYNCNIGMHGFRCFLSDVFDKSERCGESCRVIPSETDRKLSLIHI